jgi:hypothetical protein
VQRGVAGQLRVQRDGEHVALPDRHRVAVDLGEDLDVVAGVGDPRRADEHRVDVVAEHGQVGLERGPGGPTCCASRRRRAPRGASGRAFGHTISGALDRAT